MKAWFNKLHDFRTLPKRILSSKNGILGTIVAAACVLLAVAVMSAPKPDKKAVEETAWPVTTITAEPTSISPELRLFGRVESPRQSALKASLVAHVASVPVLEGSEVKAGEVLVQLDPTDAALAVQRSDADLTEARADVASLKLKIEENRSVLTHQSRLNDLAKAKAARYEKLRAQQSVSQETLNAALREADQQAIAWSHQKALVDDARNQLVRAEARVRRAEAALDEAKENLDRTSIRAPFDGRVTAVSVSPGELVQPGSPIADIYDTSSLEVRAQIPANQLPTIKHALAGGTELAAKLDVDGVPVAARLARLSGQVSKGSSSVDGLFAVDPTAQVEVGRAVAVVVTMPRIDNAIALPVQAIYGHDRIYVVRDERLQAVNIARLGELSDGEGHMEVVVSASHIPEKAAIVTSQLTMAVTGLKVKPGKSSARQDSAGEVAVTRAGTEQTGS